VYGEKAFTMNTQRALQTSPCSSCCSDSIVDDWKGNNDGITSAEGNGFRTGGHGKKGFVPKFQKISG
jgi:hypothetical protein